MRTMRSRIGWILAAAALCALPVAAQEQVGSVAGRVTDAEGGALPGATVELAGPGLGALVATTDERGNYRFPRVPPGVYTVTARLEGFQTVETTEVSVILGRTQTVEFELSGEFAEEIVVTGDVTQVDFRESGTAYSFAREQIEQIPRGRDFAAVVTQAPGVNQETDAGGISFNGASGSENRFVIDGVDSTDPRTGVQGQELRADFVEEVQVKSAGYDAEYGGSVGGVINVVTKTGTNEFQGSVGVVFETDDFNEDDRPFPERNSLEICDRTDFLCQNETDARDQLEPRFTLGGPIARNKAWYFVAWEHSEEERDRFPLNTTQSFSDEITTDTIVGNIKGNVGSRFLYRVGTIFELREDEGVLPDRNGTTPAEADLGIKTETPRESYAAYADYVATSNFYLSGRVGYYTQNTRDVGGSATARFLFNSGSPPVPASDPRFQPQGFSSVPSASFFLDGRDRWQRRPAALDANYFVEAVGEHSFKAGVSFDEQENGVERGEINGNLHIIRWGVGDRFGAGVEGEFGSDEVRSFRTTGGATNEITGIYVQDGWAVLPNLTLNLGVRAEEENIPNFPINRPVFGENAFEFDFDDKLAPRVGFAWDILSDQRFKLYGSYGNYFDIMKLEMPRGLFGADEWISYLYPLNTLDWQTLNDGCSTSVNDPAVNPCPQLGTPVAINLRDPLDPNEFVDSGLLPMQQQEWQLGLDYQLTPNIVVGATYLNRQLIDVVEDIGLRRILPDGSITETFTIGNPGQGVSVDPNFVGTGLPFQPRGKRNYDAITVTFDRRFVDNWSVSAKYTHSALRGNYSGLAQSDEFSLAGGLARTSPNVGRNFDALHMSFNERGEPEFGRLNTDRPNQFEVQGLWRAPWGTLFGVGTAWFEGAPISEQVAFAGAEFFPKGRGNLGRLDSWTQTDLYITHPFQIGTKELEVGLNVLNLFDEDTVRQVDVFRYDEDLANVIPGCDGSQDCFFGNVPFNVDDFFAPEDANPKFLEPVRFQAPREVRLDVTFRF